MLVSCGKQQAKGGPGMMMPVVSVRAVPAVAGDVPLNVSAVGTVESITSVDVKSRVAGQVLRLYFHDGDYVQKDQLLFEIDPEPLQRQIAEIKADLVKDEALEQQSRANVIKDQAMLKQTRAAADRGVQLLKEGIFSKEQTEQVVANADSSQATLDADKAAVESSVAAIKADRARLAQTELQLTYTKITAPIAGRAGAIAVKPGNLIKDNDAALVTLLQLSPIYVSFGVPEQILPQVQKYNAQRPLIVHASASGEQPASGTLRFIDNTVDNTTGTIKLKAQFDNPDHKLWPGQFVNVTARLEMEHNRILVPNRTVQTGPQGRYVWVLNQNEGTVAIRPVNVLRTVQDAKSSETAVIGSGLKPGEMVISEGQMLLAPGSKVHLLKPQTELGDSGGGKTAAQS
ncbi:MAG: efflux RND transporter periplasmic adaptor subunit [Acidobacteriaceae bacterium]|nr:efflux RND transporter periplasmic adaptor subunit [Acidobacteriaceae bacterium]